MKYVFCILFTGLLFAFSQEDKYDLKIDSGVGSLKINTQLKDVKGFVKPVDKSGMWFPPQESKYVSYNTYMVNMAKFPVKKFYGLTIERIEILFQPHFTEEGEEDGQDIYEFNVFISWPGDAAHDKLIASAEKDMGPIRTYSIDESSIGSEEEIESPNWFTSKTLMTIAGKKAFKTFNGKKYLWVKYMQAFGG
ncbi:MAG TPA: hypothetical protein VK177_13640 [Flavobacteriales bacterium]|nr:hypothetical protein [Flavobacteriales bacterium]